jgi:hypothetical protein
MCGCVLVPCKKELFIIINLFLILMHSKAQVLFPHFPAAYLRQTGDNPYSSLLVIVIYNPSTYNQPSWF